MRHGEQDKWVELEQAIFDRVVSWHCDVGCLIDPQEYPEAAEFLTEEGDILDLFHSNCRIPDVVREHVGLLSRLESACAEGTLTLVARDFGLEYRRSPTPSTEQLQ